MSADAILNQRAAVAKAAAVACTARFLADLLPLGEDRRVKLTGFSKAKDIRANGIGRASMVPAAPACPSCGRRTRRPTGHRLDCARYST